VGLNRQSSEVRRKIEITYKLEGTKDDGVGRYVII